MVQWHWRAGGCEFWSVQAREHRSPSLGVVVAGHSQPIIGVLSLQCQYFRLIKDAVYHVSLQVTAGYSEMNISQPHEFQVFRFSVFLVCARLLDAFWMGSVSAGVDAVKRRLQNVIKDEDVLCKKKEDARQKLKNLTARRKRRWERAFQIYCKTVPDALPAIQFLRLSSNCTYFPESERQLQALLEEKFLSCNIDVLAEASHMEVRTGTRKTVWKNSSEALIEALTVNWIQQTNTEQARAPQSQEVLSAMRRIPSLAPCADSPSAWLPITEQHKSVLRRFKQRWRLRRGTLGTDPGLSFTKRGRRRWHGKCSRCNCCRLLLGGMV